MIYRLALLFLAACGVPDRVEIEWVREYDGYLPGVDEGKVAVVLVRDALTGKPLQGAVVRQHLEGEVTEEGEWAPLVNELRTDQYGLAWVLLPENPGPCHWTIHAQGYAPNEEFDEIISEEIELERGQRIRGRLVGPFGEPVVGAHVEYKLGCAHAPALATTATDRDGVYEFRGIIDGDYPYYAPGIEAGYGWVYGNPDLPICDLHASAGGPIEGRILRASGLPFEWGVIQNVCNSRGPMSRLRPDGSFRIEGGAPANSFAVYLRGRDVSVPAQYRPGGPFVVRLDAPPEATVQRVQLVGDNVHGPVVFERESDGRRWSGSVINPPRLPRGRYCAIVGDVTSPYAGRSQPIDVPGPERVRMEVHGRPQLEITWEEPALADGTVVLSLGTDSFEWIVNEDGAMNALYLPATARAALRVERQGAMRYFPIAAASDGVRRAHVRMPGRKRLVVPDAGRADNVTLYGGIMQLEDELGVAANSVRTRATGPVVLHVEFSGAEQRLLRFELPEHSAEPVQPLRVERNLLPPVRKLTLLGPGRAPVQDAEIDFAGDSLEWYWKEDATASFGFYGDEPASRWLRDGAWLSIKSFHDAQDYLMPLHVRLRGDGPYTVRWGDCVVRVRGRVIVYCDGRMDCGEYVENGFVIRGIAAGEHTLIFAADGRRSQVHRIFLRPGEERVIDAKLSPR